MISAEGTNSMNVLKSVSASRPRPAPHKPPNPSRPIRPNLNAKRVNTVIPASENFRGDVPEEDKGGRLFAKPYK